jgi:hypothetical protein
MCVGYDLRGFDTDATVDFLDSQGLFHSASEKMYRFVPVHPPATPAPLMRGVHEEKLEGEQTLPTSGVYALLTGQQSTSLSRPSKSQGM